MFCLSDELINLVSPFLLQLFFLWPCLMDGEWGCTEATCDASCRLPQPSGCCCAGAAVGAVVGMGVFLFWFHFVGTRLAQAVAQVAVKSGGLS